MKWIFRFGGFLLLFTCIVSTFSCQKNIKVIDSRLTGDSVEFVKYTIAGSAHNFLSPADSFRTATYGSSVTVFAHPRYFTDSANWKFTCFNFSNVTGPGTYALDPGSLLVTKGIYPPSDFDYHDIGPVVLTISEFGPTGGIIAGHFSGTLEAWINLNIHRSFTCEFRVVRSF